MLTNSHGPKPLHLHGFILPEAIEKDVYVVNGHVTFLPQEHAVTILKAGFILPGLVDVHAHLALASPADARASAEEKVRASALAHLEAGVLAIREPGSPNYNSAKIGPHEGLAREAGDAELPKAAEEEARKSGGWAKVIGDFTDLNGHMRPNYKVQTLIETAKRVHTLGARIALHATTPEVIASAIEAGFDSIEHGWGVQDDHLAEMKIRGIAFVPTMTILAEAPHFLPGMGLSHDDINEELKFAKMHPDRVRRAFEAGVTILAGTDAGIVKHGLVAEEIRLLIEAGLPSEAALAAGSWSARRYLGLPCVEEGAPADLTAYTDDPRSDLKALAQPALRMLGD
jgi:imidazolonepropionase-like amidohydrolase